MDGFDSKPLNAPNDVIVHSDGSVWFTDPGWGSRATSKATARSSNCPAMSTASTTAGGHR